MAITRITAQWNGFRGAPGYSNFFFDGGPLEAPAIEACATAVRLFFNSARSWLAEGTTINFQPTADTIDEASGQIIGQVDFSTPPVVTSSASGSYSAATGAVVNWNTNDYVAGRRVRGRTFLVPLSGGAFDSNGDLGGTTLGELRTGADNLVSATLDAPLCVWSRPRNGAGGSAHVVSSASVPDLGAILRSRRD